MAVADTVVDSAVAVEVVAMEAAAMAVTVEVMKAIHSFNDFQI